MDKENEISGEMRLVIEGCLMMDEKKRWSLAKIHQSKWFSVLIDERKAKEDLEQRIHSKTVCEMEIEDVEVKKQFKDVDTDDG